MQKLRFKVNRKMSEVWTGSPNLGHTTLYRLDDLLHIKLIELTALRMDEGDQTDTQHTNRDR